MKTEPNHKRLQQSSSARDTRANQQQAPRQDQDEDTNVDGQKEAAMVNTAKDRTMDPILLTGTTTILAKNRNKAVRVLLDTGSQLSFIDSRLVAELELPVVNESKLRVKTFGSNRINEESHKVVEDANNIYQKEKNAVLLTEVEEKGQELEMFDKYWSLESSGTNEYAGPDETEKQRTNEEFAKKFKETIERRQDGYYVRLPWKTTERTYPPIEE
ncbi:hypothetical protein OESDEN_20360 [Oesophagostomum dentatum]|uniref:Peptidase aspartic putative domain-containing protein n=1 Tax=Oesophagostomum dentatum TaxID=61180 RepID=A0A0B1S4W7_OESDE|nr:hypothetical protein OESDEN_20360 [Oesophagostomum dentatum]